jgi:hypothetical protein
MNCPVYAGESKSKRLSKQREANGRATGSDPDENQAELDRALPSNFKEEL